MPEIDQSPALPGTPQIAIWIALVAVASVLFALALACAAPFAALASLGGLALVRRDAIFLMLAAWLANQGVGYAILDYPRTFDSFAWGGMILFAGILAVLAARAVAQRPLFSALRIAAAFVAAFAVYEGALLAATIFLPSGAAAFSLAVVAQIFALNVLAFAGFWILYRLGAAGGLIVAGAGSSSVAQA